VEERVFFDRGILDSLTPAAPDWMRKAAASHRYNRTVFVPPPWEEIYTQDAERKQTFEDCLAVHAAILRQLLELGYQAIEVPRGAPAERAAFVLRMAKGPAEAGPSQIV
jgi:predicted ATPase